MRVRTLLIDNYDSYTYNLHQLIAEVNGEPPTVVHNDAVDVAWVLAQLAAGRFHNIVVSPGPGSPAAAADVGLCVALLQAAPAVPILGVCLGFQALALAHGGVVGPAPEPVHGRLSAVRHAGHPLFAGVPSGARYRVVRYHSLAVEESSLPACLEAVAWTCGGHCAPPTGRDAAGRGEDDAAAASAADADAAAGAAGGGGGGVLMALAHRSLPHYGVQYHPESIATGYGAALLQNFRDLTAAHHGLPPQPPAARPAGPPGRRLPAAAWAQPDGNLDVRYVEVPRILSRLPGGTEALFRGVVLGGRGGDGSGSDALDDTFWLDTSAPDRGRFSFMGGRGGPLWRRITYELPSLAQFAAAGGRPLPGTLTTVAADGRRTQRAALFWEWLEAELARWRLHVDAASAASLPFNFWGGLVGYLGYELKAECGGAAAHQADTPDAALLLADRLLAADHATGSVYAVAMHERGSAAAEAEAAAWVADTAASVERLAAAAAGAAGASAGAHGGAPAAPPGPEFELREGRQQYEANVEACMQALRAGQSYELCLTTSLARAPAPPPWPLYTALRAVNPVPYAAWLRLGGGGPALCCSSPERFLRGDRGGALEAKPIKGTAPRRAAEGAAADAAAAAALAASEKDRAENLMIVDLLRNDLGRVCAPGSVHVPSLMRVESFATVHQLVSTVRGQRAEGASAAAAVRAAFPGGSMTGAPKVRSMQILDALEGGARGPYSGAAGYLAFNDTFDLNIVIRSAVVHAGRVAVGAGGAVVVQSDPGEEYEEMRLKAEAVLRAVGRAEGRAAGVAGDAQR